MDRGNRPWARGAGSRHGAGDDWHLGGGWLSAGPYTITAPSTTIASSPPGAQVTVDGTAYTTPQTFAWAAGTQHTLSAPSSISGTGMQGTFANWSDSGSQSHSITVGASSATYTANYTAQYYLTTAVSGSGTVTPSSGCYAAGRQVTVTASSLNGSQFVSFTGTVNTNQNPYSFTMSGPLTETAQFGGAIFTISPNSSSQPYYQTVQLGGTATYTVLPPPGYIGAIQLTSVTASCGVNDPNGPPVGGPNPSATVNADGSTVTCASYSAQHGYTILTVNVNVYGVSPKAYEQTLIVYLQAATTPTLSLATSLLSKTATTATYMASVSTQSYSGTVNLGAQSDSCAVPIGASPSVTMPGGQWTASQTISVSTAGCAPGTNGTITFTASGGGVTANPQTAPLQTAPAAAVMTSPPPGATIPGGATSFSWSTVTGATYCLYAGTAQQSNCSGSASSPASVTLPTSGTVYATLGTQVNGVWQYQQYAYVVNPSPPAQTLTVTAGPALAAVGDTGAEIQYTYTLAGGDATLLSKVSTSGAGVTARIVGQSGSQVVIGLTAAKGSPQQKIQIALCDPTEEVCPVSCLQGDPNCVELPGGGADEDVDITVSPPQVTPGSPAVVAFNLSWDPESTSGLTITSLSATLLGSTDTYGAQVGNNPDAWTPTFDIGLNSGPMNVCLSLDGYYVLAGDETQTPYPFTQNGGCYEVDEATVSLSPSRIVVGAGSSFTITATEYFGTLPLIWSIDNPGLLASPITNCNGSPDPNSGNAPCVLVAGASGGKGNITVTVQDGTSNPGTATAQIIVISAGYLSISQTATANPATGAVPATSSVTTVNTILAFAAESKPPQDPTDLAAVIEGSGTVTVAVGNPLPFGSANYINWEIDEDPTDTVPANGNPSPFPGAFSGAQTTFLPNLAGNYRVIAWVDSNGNGRFDPGEQLFVYRIAIVRITVQPGATFALTNALTGSTASATTAPDAPSTIYPMQLSGTYLLEGGGQGQTLGITRIQVGNVGNLTGDSLAVQYPATSGNPTSGTGTEVTLDPNKQPIAPPIVDSSNILAGRQSTGGSSPFRGQSSPQLLASPEGGGVLLQLNSQDGPGWGWDASHPATGNPWATSSGTVTFQEFVVAYSASSSQTYLPLQSATWTVNLAGTNSGGSWQGTSSSGISGSSALQSAGSAAVQVWGYSFLNQRTFTYVPLQ